MTAAPHATHRRALIVDDDKTMVKTLSEILQLKGWHVATAHTGEAAVEAATNGGAFDVVLMDIKMPGIDGVEAFKAMKAAQPDIRVVLMTGYAGEDRIAEAEREGVVRVLPKPVNIAALLTLLAECLSSERPVLLIDDDAAFIRTLSDLLRLRGFEIVVAEDVGHATRVMSECRPIAVLLHMRGGEGENLREAAKAVHNVSPSSALILYSGKPGAAEEVRRSLPREWVHAYLQKPFAVDEVTGVLNAIRSGR